MRVNEIFYSLQGEGPWIGFPSIFIRLGGCVEPYCSWCDTKYAWYEYREMFPDEIIASIKKFSCMRVVITGGEPFAQWDSGLSDLHEKLLELGYSLQYETSGKVDFSHCGNALIVCSPKYMKERWLIERKTIERVDVFKFVAHNEKDLHLIERFVEENRIDKDRVYIMPEGATRREQMENMPRIFNFCREKGFRMTPRLHILTFGAKRGV